MSDRTLPDEVVEELAALVALGGADAVGDPDQLAAVADDPRYLAALGRHEELVAGFPATSPLSGDLPAPPPSLRDRIVPAPAATGGPPVWIGSVAAAAIAVVLGVAIGRVTVPVPPAPPIETVALDVAAFDVTTAEIIAHTWGTELLFTFDGTVSGEVYDVVVVGRDGSVLAAGSFLGDAERTVDCEMNVALLRPDAAAFEIRDAAGELVVAADLPATER